MSPALHIVLVTLQQVEGDQAALAALDWKSLHRPCPIWARAQTPRRLELPAGIIRLGLRLWAPSPPGSSPAPREAPRHRDSRERGGLLQPDVRQPGSGERGRPNAPHQPGSNRPESSPPGSNQAGSNHPRSKRPDSTQPGNGRPAAPGGTKTNRPNQPSTKPAKPDAPPAPTRTNEKRLRRQHPAKAMRRGEAGLTVNQADIKRLLSTDWVRGLDAAPNFWGTDFAILRRSDVTGTFPFSSSTSSFSQF